ncbi:hypothetical protein [Bifidobacterium stellenboschense]|nr:hypothetical protein [Bifidobacterium stellenboschense]
MALRVQRMKRVVEPTNGGAKDNDAPPAGTVFAKSRATKRALHA